MVLFPKYYRYNVLRVRLLLSLKEIEKDAWFARYLHSARAMFLYGASDRKLILRPVSLKAVAVYRLRNAIQAYIMHYAPASKPVYFLADQLFQCQDRTTDWSAMLEPSIRSAECPAKYSSRSGSWREFAIERGNISATVIYIVGMLRVL